MEEKHQTKDRNKIVVTYQDIPILSMEQIEFDYARTMCKPTSRKKSGGVIKNRKYFQWSPPVLTILTQCLTNHLGALIAYVNIIYLCVSYVDIVTFSISLSTYIFPNELPNWKRIYKYKPFFRNLYIPKWIA